LASIAGPEAVSAEVNGASTVGLPEPSLAAANVAAIENLASGIQSLVTNMRAEQQLIRDWVEAQAAREAEIKAVLLALHKAIDGKG
jgi:hypothetical protein